ncbi:MAG: response regulator [Betaproteobacteria bacterium]|nr:response regulator [Betaproteobacteria bacterium]
MLKELVVDDPRTPRMDLTKMLQPMGHIVTMAENGETGLAACMAQRQGLVLADGCMAVLGGYETGRCLGSTLSNDWVPITFLAGSKDDPNSKRAIATGGDDFRLKPVNYLVPPAEIQAERSSTAPPVTPGLSIAEFVSPHATNAESLIFRAHPELPQTKRLGASRVILGGAALLENAASFATKEIAPRRRPKLDAKRFPSFRSRFVASVVSPNTRADLPSSCRSARSMACNKKRNTTSGHRGRQQHGWATMRPCAVAFVANDCEFRGGL